MDVQIDRTKVYTSGEWVHGTVEFYSGISGLKKVLVQLWGTIIVSKNDGDREGPTTREPKQLYYVSVEFDPHALKARASKRADGKSIDFAVQFPGHENDCYQILPASTISSKYGALFEIHHWFTVTIIEQVSPDKKQWETKELKFTPSASISRLLEPNKLCHKPSIGSPSLAANLYLPQFLAQGTAANFIKIELLDSESQSEHILFSALSVRLIIYIDIEGKRVVSTSVPMKHKCLPGDLIEVFLHGVFDRCTAFSLKGVKLRYGLRLTLTVAENGKQKHRVVNVENPVDFLPTLLYKKNREHFARPDEVLAMLKLRTQGLTSSMTTVMTDGELDSIATTSTTTSVDRANDTTSPPNYSDFN